MWRKERGDIGSEGEGWKWWDEERERGRNGQRKVGVMRGREGKREREGGREKGIEDKREGEGG